MYTQAILDQMMINMLMKKGFAWFKVMYLINSFVHSDLYKDVHKNMIV